MSPFHLAFNDKTVCKKNAKNKLTDLLSFFRLWKHEVFTSAAEGGICGYFIVQEIPILRKI